MALTPEEEAALPENARQELFDLREANGQLEAAAEAAIALRNELQISWNGMQLSRNAAQDLRLQMQKERDLAQRLRDRYAQFLAEVDAIRTGTGTNAQKLSALGTAINTCRADLATILAGG